MPFSLPLLQRITFAYLIENIHIQSEIVSKTISIHLPEIPEKIKNGIIKAQNKALLSSLAPSVKVEMLKQFSWEVYDVEYSTFILPDCIAICHKINSIGPHPLAFEDIDELNVIIAPLSPARILIGNKYTYKKEIIDCFNENAAKCSHSFFISSYKNKKIVLLIQKISEMTCASLKYKAQASMNSAISEYFHDNEENIIIKGNDDINISNHAIKLNINVTVSTDGNFKKEYNDNLEYTLKDIFQYFYMNHPMSTLGHIKFNEIFPENKNNSNNTFFTTLETLYVDGRLISNIHAHSDLAVQMILADKTIRYQGIQIFLNLLFRISFRENFYHSKNELFNTIMHCISWNDIIFRNFIDSYEEYFSTRGSAHISPNLSEYCNFSKKIIGDISQDILMIKDNFSKTNNFEEFFNKSIIFIRNLLSQIASVLGHHDGLPEEKSECFWIFLQQFSPSSLNLWIMSLWHDFRYLYDNYHAAPTEEALRQLSSHSERALWQFGIFFWDEGDKIKVFIRS